MSEVKKVYFHRGQLQAMRIQANREYIVAPRGWGKSEGIDAPRLIRNVFAMPRSAGAILSPTYGKLLRNTLPAVFAALGRLGYKRNVHYFVGEAPPKMNFARPLIDPLNYKYTIHWFNGSIQNLISYDVPMSSNSMSLDYIMGFEARYLDYDKMTNETFQANRGNEKEFGHCPWHHGHVFTTDMPTTKAGNWIFEKEKEMDKELIATIEETQREINLLKNNNINPNRINKLTKYLGDLRKNATYFCLADPFDNLQLLGENFFRNNKRDLPPYVFNTSILNKRYRKIDGGFYAGLNERLHYYTSYNNSFLEGLDYNIKRAVESDCRKDGDLNNELPLAISLDYNAHINWLAVGQSENKLMRTLKTFYVKGEKRMFNVLQDFDNYYSIRQNRDIVYYYSNTALQGAYAISNETFADFVIKTLTNFGWNVYPVYMGQAPSHSNKHRYINDALKGVQYLFPLFNHDNNEELIIAMEQTGTKIGPKGFEKNKSGEKLIETPQDQLEYRTDGTDAWDELFMGLNFFSMENVVGGSVATMWNK